MRGEFWDEDVGSREATGRGWWRRKEEMIRKWGETVDVGRSGERKSK